jgi:hypothetical protein
MSSGKNRNGPLLAMIVRSGFAAANSEIVTAGGPLAVTWLTITDLGRQALAG